MKFTLSWLKEHLDTDAGIGDILAALPALGLDVDSVVNHAESLKDFITAEVIEAKQHPDADRLSVCQVNTGSETIEVVCGAPNARTGLKGVFAASGTVVPGTGIKLKKSKIRGVTSNGMLLSEREMGLSDNHDTIIELPADTPIGASAVDVMGLDDPIIDIEITPNRADCLGVRGIARDLAAAGIGTLKPLDTSPVSGDGESSINVHLEFDGLDPSPCPFFAGRVIRGVKNVESPKWLQDWLTAVGLRPISALVDITNLMTIGYCRPMHVFDADKIHGDLHVRLARPGEKLLALDGETHELDETMTVIADDEAVESLGGVIGGERTGCTEETVNVFVESAYFDPVRTAGTGRKLNLITDARYRFERGVDPAFVQDGLEIATRLILDICGGEASTVTTTGAEPTISHDIPFRAERVETLGGMTLPVKTIETILNALGFEIQGQGSSMTVRVPSWRSDVVGEADIVEEVMRVHGLDHLQAVPLPRASGIVQARLTPRQRQRALVRRTLAAQGLLEAVTYSFMPSDVAGLFGKISDDCRLSNPISSDLDVMRPSILANLLAAAGRNADRGYPDNALFEVGPQYVGVAADDQSIVAAGIRAGQTVPRHWGVTKRAVDVYDAKADAMAALSALGVSVERMQISTNAAAYFHPGRSGCLTQGPKTVLAQFGEIHPFVLREMGITGPAVGFEVFLESIPSPKSRKGSGKPPLELAAFQPVERDFAFVVDESVSAEDLIRAAGGAEKKLITQIEVFDVFSGGNIGDGKKSVGLSVTLQPMEQTLTEAEIEGVSEKIIAKVSKATGAVLRTS
ncbi:MAG: phenylalanine--tRNA ligase subunit beta [Rhodospirillaceae bacterium]|jgi:phenylalanyl-tRNA synthetase beta chain